MNLPVAHPRTADQLSRRTVLGGVAVSVAGTAVSGLLRGSASPVRRAQPTPRREGWYAPDDNVRHERTWMAWPARRDIWGSMLPGVRDDVARVAQAIAVFEPVAMVARPDQAREAARACGKGVEIVELVNDDLWMRDMGPVFLVDGHGGLAGLDMNFNGWGNKQVHVHDAKIAREVLALLGVRRFVAPFVSEGGALVAAPAGAGSLTLRCEPADWPSAAGCGAGAVVSGAAATAISATAPSPTKRR